MRRAVATASLLALVALSACSQADDSTPQAAPVVDAPTVAAAYLAAWSAGKPDEAGAATTSPQDATAALTEVSTDLQVSTIKAAVATTTPAPVASTDSTGAERISVPFAATLTLKGLGNWPYSSFLPMVKQADGWKVDWSPAVIDRTLTPFTKLARVQGAQASTTILDRAGKKLVAPRPVVEILIQPDKLVDAEAAYAVLGKLGRTPANAKAQVAEAAPTSQLFQIAVRPEVFKPVAAEVKRVGLITKTSQRSLAATADFGRAILGDIQESAAGASGSTGGTVSVVARDASSEVEPVVLYRFAGSPTLTVKSTLDTAMQQAAEAALAKVKDKTSALVAIDSRTGAVLAAANHAAGGGTTSFNRAFVGQYPPGSTFKVVTSAALLARGLDIDAKVDCPKQAVVSGKAFENVDQYELGSVPFRTDFAQSCNTAFVGLSKDLPDAAIGDAAQKFGFGSDYAAGTSSFSGSIKALDTDVAKAAAAIGQGTVLASPLAMATVAATVTSGGYSAPYVIVTTGQRPAKQPLAEAASLKTLMRGVVTAGSARPALGAISGTVGAKTGTAEFGSNAGTHAWIIGFRNDIAFAVLLENGGAGGKNAGPVARDFLRAIS